MSLTSLGIGQAAADTAAAAPPVWQSLLERARELWNQPTPYSDQLKLLAVMLLLWLLLRRSQARRPGAEDLRGRATDVLKDRLARGEINRETYEKIRAELDSGSRKR
ncbi:MAG: hypothetical protein HY561_05320 [Gemmatimonadetes bacterium]|nr:hypothetical protein [Gemmatimonadota bacterium]